MIRTDIFWSSNWALFILHFQERKQKEKKFKLISPLTDLIFDLIYCSLAKETDSMNT